MKITIAIIGAGLLTLAGCAGQSATVATDTSTATAAVSTVTGYAEKALTVAEAAMAAYAATSNPSQAVITEAKKLAATAQTAINQYGPEASTAIAAAGALAEYLLTSAPGNGVTPSSVPAAG